MDPLSISASIAGLLALTGTVIRHLSTVEEASETRGRFFLEVSSARGLLYSLNDLCSQTEMSSGCFISLKSLCTPQGPFEQFKEALELLAAKLAPMKGSAKVKKALTWIFNQTEVNALLDVVERQKTYYLLALQGNNVILSQELARSIAGIDLKIRSIQDGIDDLNVEQTRQGSQQLQQNELDVLTWLSPATPAKRQRDLLNQVQPGTGKWLLTHDAFLNWLTSPVSSQMLWLAGIPGSGKTSLASIVIDHLEREFRQSDIGIAYVFCDYKDTTQTSDKLKRVILRQLLHRLDDLPREVEKLYQVHARRSTDPSSSELDDALLPTICRFSRLFVVIDGLDELSGMNDASESLLKLCKELSPNIQSLITSRWTVGLRDDIQQATHIEVFAQDQDIDAYLRHEIESNSRLKLFMQKEPAFKDQIISTILGNCRGMFLVARLHIESLAGKPHLRAAKLALKLLPSTLDGVYDNAIDRIKKQSEEDVVLAWRVLSWTVRAIKRLTSEQLQHALAVDENCDELDADALIDIDLILLVCAGLVVLDSQDSTVRLVHYTAQEFFERHGSNLLPEADRDIAFTCLQYLSFCETTGVSTSDEDLIKKLTAFPFLEYAAPNWGKHVAKCKSGDDELDGLVERFLNGDACIPGALQIMLMPTSRHEGFSQHMTKEVDGLHLAAHFGLTGMIEKLLGVHNVQTRDEAGRSPLHWAARAGHSLTANFLLERGGEVDTQDCVDGTPLHLASRYGHLEVVLVLIEHGCDVNKCNNVGGTALIWAAIGGSQEIATILLKHGADVRAKTKTGSTALHRAVTENNEAVVRLLLQHEAEVYGMDKIDLHTPLLAATSKSNEAIMCMLLEAGALLDFKTNLGTTVLHCAATRRTDGPTRMLLRFGANPSGRDSLGRTPLHIAVHYGNLASTSVLMSVAQMDAVDNYNQTVLHAAVNLRTEHMDGEIVRMLLNSQKIDIEAIDTNGWSALTYATYQSLLKTTKLLLDAGANPALQTLAVQALEESSPSASMNASYSGLGNPSIPSILEPYGDD